ncbi:MAG TPA: hypothetical protein VKT21_07140 [Thermoplasmata archaeon]|nr:hypothetical protein [Thermoplasmata archaeon]
MDRFYTRARAAGALGGKLTGAGGGGFLLLFCDFRRRQDVAKAVVASGGRVMEFDFSPEGAQSWAVRTGRVEAGSHDLTPRLRRK